MRNGVRLDFVNRALKIRGIEQVADSMFDAAGRCHRQTRIEAEDNMVALRKQLGEVKPDEACASSDEYSQGCLPSSRMGPRSVRSTRRISTERARPIYSNEGTTGRLRYFPTLHRERTHCYTATCQQI